MEVNGIKAKKVFAGPGTFAWIAEANVFNVDGEELCVTVQYYDGEEYTVQKGSMYEELAGEKDTEQDIEFIEEYSEYADAKQSTYANIFEKLRIVIEMLG